MVTFEDILAARRRIEPFVKRTPLDKNSAISKKLGTQAYLKLELFQETGSFKPRGAFNQILQLSEEQKQAGVVAVSGGNFAQGVAYAGQVLGIQTLICMPETTPKNYIEATKSYGARIELAPTIAGAFERLHFYQAQGMTPLHPYDSPRQMAGTGTIGLEILEDLPELTDVIISIGGGGLIAGMLVAIKTLKPAARVWGVETEGADTMGQALRAGKVVHIQPTSLAKTLGAPYVAEDALLLAQKHLQECLTVSDKAAFEAQLFLLERAKIVTELAASCTLAAAERLKDVFKESDQVVLLMCGGNTSLDNLIEYRRILSNDQ